VKINFFLIKSIFFVCTFFVCLGWTNCFAMDESDFYPDDIAVDVEEEVLPATPATIEKEKPSSLSVKKEDFADKLKSFYRDVCNAGMNSKFDNEKNLKSLSLLVNNIGSVTVDQIQGLINSVNFYLSLLKDFMKQDKKFDSIENDFRNLLAQATKELWLKKGVAPAGLKDRGLQSAQPAQAALPVVVRSVRQQDRPQAGRVASITRGQPSADKGRRAY
jgi:hypothetical protein